MPADDGHDGHDGHDGPIEADVADSSADVPLLQPRANR